MNYLDLDAIKACGLNSDEHSFEMLDRHDKAARIQLHSDLWSKWLRYHPDASALEIQDFAARMAVEVGL